MIQIAFITGRSDPRSCRLGPDQLGFLERLRRPDVRLVSVNFPYATDGAAYRGRALAAASVANALDYLRSSRPAFVETYRPAVVDLLLGAPHTVLLAGSCGLQLLVNLRLPPPVLARASVFAFGPVATRRPACREMLVQGRRDLLSRCFFRDVDLRVDCGHLDYLGNADVADACRAFVDATVVRHGPRACEAT